MRGELLGPATCSIEIRGSSPHAWGTHQTLLHMPADHRFIPTCVGNSRRSSRCSTTTPVHPHMRGELASVAITIPDTSGSSPHAWGTRRHPARGRFPPRFIPTCVGNSLPSSWRTGCPPVHPHMRGELGETPRTLCPGFGSSPHAWGTRSGCSLR